MRVAAIAQIEKIQPAHRPVAISIGNNDLTPPPIGAGVVLAVGDKGGTMAKA
jgi:hypothetical protein